MGGYRKEFAQTFQSTEQKTQTGTQSFQQRSYQQTIDKRSYVNGTSVSIEDFKVSYLFKQKKINTKQNIYFLHITFLYNFLIYFLFIQLHNNF